MNENLGQSQTPVQAGAAGEAPELYNPNAAGLWSVLLSAVFGSWCVWRNYKALGDQSKEKVALIAMIVWLVLYVAMALVALFTGLNMTLPGLIALIVWYYAVQKPQVKFLKQSGIQYRKKSLVIPVLCGIAAVVAWFLLWWLILTILVSMSA